MWHEGFFSTDFQFIVIRRARSVFGTVREDTEGRVKLDALNRKPRWFGFSPQLLIGYVKRDSTLEINRYDRLYSRVGLSTSF